MSTEKLEEIGLKIDVSNILIDTKAYEKMEDLFNDIQPDFDMEEFAYKLEDEILNIVSELIEK